MHLQDRAGFCQVLHWKDKCNQVTMMTDDITPLMLKPAVMFQGSACKCSALTDNYVIWMQLWQTKYLCCYIDLQSDIV